MNLLALTLLLFCFISRWKSLQNTNSYISKCKQFGRLYPSMGKIVVGSQATLKFKDFVSFSAKRSAEI